MIDWAKKHHTTVPLNTNEPSYGLEQETLMKARPVYCVETDFKTLPMADDTAKMATPVFSLLGCHLAVWQGEFLPVIPRGC